MDGPKEFLRERVGMKRLAFAIVASLALSVLLLAGCASSQSSASAEAGSKSGAGYTEQTLKVVSNKDGAPAELTVRFYDDMPNVPYFGLSQYKEVVFGDKNTV